MMGTLLNMRRGGRSPPLLVVALVSCIILFGFNYWVSSSRNFELQTKVRDLEDTLRQATGEKAREKVGRSVAEEQVRRQTQQLALLEGAHQRRQQTALTLWNQEKESLLLNMSSNAKTLEDMKYQMKSLFQDLSRVQKELTSCQNKMNTLSKRVTYDITQCNTQILAEKEECKEKLAAAKLGVPKSSKKKSAASAAQPAGDPAQKAVESKTVAEAPVAKDLTKMSRELTKKKPALESKPETDDQLETNEIPEADQTVKDSDKTELQLTQELPSQNVTGNSQADTLEGVMDIKGGDVNDTDALFDAATVTKEKEEDAIEYDNEGEIEKRLSKLKDDKAAAQEFEEELADYNGDDENEPEFEADKQKELAME